MIGSQGLSIDKMVAALVYDWKPRSCQSLLCLWVPSSYTALLAGLQITLKLQGPCGLLTYQVLLTHIDILGPTFSMKC